MSLLDEAIAEVNKTPTITPDKFYSGLDGAMKELRVERDFPVPLKDRQLNTVTPPQIQAWLESFMHKPCGIGAAVSVVRCEEIGLDMGDLTYAGLSADGNPVAFFGDDYLEAVQKYDESNPTPPTEFVVHPLFRKTPEFIGDSVSLP